MISESVDLANKMLETINAKEIDSRKLMLALVIIREKIEESITLMDSQIPPNDNVKFSESAFILYQSLVEGGGVSTVTSLKTNNKE